MTLKEYLTSISMDPGKLETLRKYPACALKGVDISDPTERQALVSGDWQKIRERLGGWAIIIYDDAQVKLQDFVQDLARDGDLRVAFKSNPAEMLARVKMPEQEKQMLLQQDWPRVRKELELRLQSTLEAALPGSRDSET